MNIITVRLAVITLSLFVSGQVHAYRCQSGSLVLPSDSAFEVRRYCGEPADKEYVGLVRVGGKYVNVDRYYYIPPAGSFLRIIEFHNGIVANVIRGRRVQ